ncbi:MAG TPA: phospho-N-acetylmuramoyl-pentapeptide-transferase [Verrucomicrobiota bacterium]|jgi:phospho-N-acetylmuramoyl-pentapeptide-transferase|nr:phospho-N-acetylmuramoyl-pentapeptide-transferase [Verrucomicrobiota bacterium]OQB92926.1 MAG: Phospho-N-acetylmuramoyl-pentapeptide-transferase [Verrucomicrobia bacterium ADurb.Bin118]HPY30452.1 phospho-N-acetylmuramoyl-pentapeptide-transferase [Verrucomicrobiota bacterium]HQB15353.1 phospho-N-acetylmuramoyl-pentapeptide-transferase [Verrucomicrobiota bacterium]
MIYYLSQALQDWVAETAWADHLSFLRLFRYITVRSAGAATTALVLSWWLGPKIIAWLRQLKFGQEYADRAEEAGDLKARVLSKKGTPTMGGLLIVLVLTASTLIWAAWNLFVELTLLSVLVLCGLGFYDDYAKITQQSGGGARPGIKLWVQVALALFIGIYLWLLPDTSKLITDIMVPFYKYPVLTGAGVVGLIITGLAIVGSSNAVNLTDGLDGLAIGCTLITAFVFLVFTYVAGNFRTAAYLQIPYVNGAGELTVFCAALIGAGLGFLWFNCHPAQVFMGDTGSLALGGALGIIAVLIHQPFVLVIAGGVFVMEAGSVIMQRGWFRYTKRRTGTGRRVFLMAPIHHHFEKKGWYESQVVMRFYILCILFAVLALATLKIR